MKKILFILFALFFLSSCSNYISRYSYNYERIDNSTQVIESRAESYAGYSHYFEDNFTKLYLDCDPYRIGIYIINKTDYPLRILWDSVKVFSEYSTNTPITITHSNKSQDDIEIPDSSSSEYSKMIQLLKLRKEDSLYVIKPTIILQNESLMDEIIPSKNDYWLPYKLNDKEILKSKAEEVVGKVIQAQLPIKIKNEIKNYIFKFTVKDFQILKKG